MNKKTPTSVELLQSNQLTDLIFKTDFSSIQGVSSFNKKLTSLGGTSIDFGSLYSLVSSELSKIDIFPKSQDISGSDKTGVVEKLVLEMPDIINKAQETMEGNDEFRKIMRKSETVGGYDYVTEFLIEIINKWFLSNGINAQVTEDWDFSILSITVMGSRDTPPTKIGSALSLVKDGLHRLLK